MKAHHFLLISNRGNDGLAILNVTCAGREKQILAENNLAPFVSARMRLPKRRVFRRDKVISSLV